MTDEALNADGVADLSGSLMSQLVTAVGSAMLQVNLASTPGTPPTRPRIAIMGQCILDTMTPEMQQALADKGMDAEIINWSGPGMTAEASLPYLDTFADRIQKHSVDQVLIFKGGNDILEGRPIAEIERDLDQFVSRIKEEGVDVMLVGVEAKDSPALSAIKGYPPEYIAAAEKMFKDVAARHDIPLYPSFFHGLEKGDFMNVKEDWLEMIDPRSETYAFTLDGFKMSGKAAYDFVAGYEDLHPNAKGEQKIASGLAEWIKENQDRAPTMTVADITPPPPASALPPAHAPAGGTPSKDQARPHVR